MAETSGYDRGGRSGVEADKWTHRQALQLIGILPDDLSDALAIIDRAKFLLEQWNVAPEARTGTAVLVLHPGGRPAKP